MTLPQNDAATDDRLLVVDGLENMQGRGLLTISALTLIAGSLDNVPVAVLTHGDPVVSTAAQCLQHDRALRLAVVEDDSRALATLHRARLYVAVGFKAFVSPYHAQAIALGIPMLVVVQFPEVRASGHLLSQVRAAHDPRVLGETILAHL